MIGSPGKVMVLLTNGQRSGEKYREQEEEAPEVRAIIRCMRFFSFFRLQAPSKFPVTPNRSAP